MLHSVLTHYGHVDLRLERHWRHLVGNLAAVDSVHVARLRGEHQDVLDHLSGDREREVQLYVVAVPVDLQEEKHLCINTCVKRRCMLEDHYKMFFKAYYR